MATHPDAAPDEGVDGPHIRHDGRLLGSHGSDEIPRLGVGWRSGESQYISVGVEIRGISVY